MVETPLVRGFFDGVAGCGADKPEADDMLIVIRWWQSKDNLQDERFQRVLYCNEREHNRENFA